MAEDKKENKKGFWARLIEAMDKKLEDRAKAGNCCCCSGNKRESKDNKC